MFDMKKERGALTLLNFSRPPSDLSMADIQSCALLKRCFKESLNGDSHGSSLITPAQQLALPCLPQCMHEILPVPSGGPAGCALMIEFTEAWLTFSMVAMQY